MNAALGDFSPQKKRLAHNIIDKQRQLYGFLLELHFYICVSLVTRTFIFQLWDI
jgi:hypothetical protein